MNSDPMKITRPIFLLILVIVAFTTLSDRASADGHDVESRLRVLVSSDIGGTDPDDFQSMVHLLLYADLFDIEGLVSSPFGPGRKSDILTVIDCYERDYPNLKSYADGYPTAAALRAVTKQGSPNAHDHTGISQPSEGSQWIIDRARREDTRPLHVLVWGGIDDLAQGICTMRRTFCLSSASIGSAARTKSGPWTPTTTSNKTIPSFG